MGAKKKKADGAGDGAAKKSARPKRGARKAPAESAGLEARACVLDPSSVAELTRRIEAEGGLVTSAYRDPLGGKPVVVAVLPISKVEPTPFQRDLSEAHAKRLADVVAKTGRYLDPIVAVTAPGSGFWTPNGRHRLEAMRRLGAKAITAIVLPDREVAWQILALNTEKAHNLKERALEVIRITRGLLAEDATRPESAFAFYLEDPALVTIGVCYERHPRFAGGAYHPILRRTEHFSDASLAAAIAVHEKLAGAVLELDEKVVAAVEKLRARGLTSPYLRSFVVARVNPLRWIKGELPPAEKVIAQMGEKAAKFNAEKVKQEDLARMGGGVPEEEG
jgi:ParB family chromosome partitioning protein